MEVGKSHISHVGYVELPEQTPKALEAPPDAPRTALNRRTLAGVGRAWLNSPKRPHARPRSPQPHRTGLAKPLALGTGKRPTGRERIKIYRATEREEPRMKVLQYLKDTLEMSPSEFMKEWRTLSDQEKGELKEDARKDAKASGVTITN